MKEYLISFGFFLAALVYLQAAEIDVVLIGGQSNATGQGRVANIPRAFKEDASVQIFYSPFLNKGKGAEQWMPLCPASESEDRFGVELSLGTSLQALNLERRIALIKHGSSGSNLYRQWNPGNEQGSVRGAEYDKFVKTVNKGMEELKKQGHEPVIRAMVWQQGEGDARDKAGMENSLKYGENLKNLIQQLRKDLKAEDMLFIYGTVMPLAAKRFPGRDAVREAQREVDEKSGKPLSVKGAFLVEADDLQMLSSDFKSPQPKDDVHLGTFGVLTLGERFAAKITREWGK